MSRHKLRVAGRAARGWQQRRGVIVVLTAFLLTVLFAFVALSVDTGRVVLTETADAERRGRGIAGRLARNSGGRLCRRPGRRARRPSTRTRSRCEAARTDGGRSGRGERRIRRSGQSTSNSASGFTIPANGDWTVQWGGTPYNVVKVTARRNGPDDLSAPDGEFPLAFGWAIGKDSVPLTDLVDGLHRGPRPGARARLVGVDERRQLAQFVAQPEHGRRLARRLWDSLVAADPKWPGTSHRSFPSTGFGTDQFVLRHVCVEHRHGDHPQYAGPERTT